MSKLSELTTSNTFQGLQINSNELNPTTNLYTLILDGKSDSGFTFDDSDVKFIMLSDNVSKIGANAFDNCTSLEKLIITDNITEIEDNAFTNAPSSLTTIEYTDSVDNWKTLSPENKFSSDSAIIVNCIDDNIYAKDNTSTTPSTPSTRIELSTYSLTITVDSSDTCTATYYVDNSPSEEIVNWTNSNESVLDMVTNGNAITLTPKATPSVKPYITATCGDQTAVLEINIINKIGEEALQS